MPCCCRSGMQSIRGKTCLSPTKAWSWSRRVPPLTCLPAQSRSSTHRLVLTASTNAQFAGRAYTPPSQHFFFLNAKERHHSRHFLFPPHALHLAQLGNWSGTFWTDGRVRRVIDDWQKDSSAALPLEQWSANVALFWPFQRLQQILPEPAGLQYSVYVYYCRPYVTSCKSCNT